MELPESPHSQGWKGPNGPTNTVSPPSLISAAPQQDSRLLMHAKKSHLCQSRLKHILHHSDKHSTNLFPVTPLCTFAKEALTRQTELKALLLIEKQRFRITSPVQHGSKLLLFFSITKNHRVPEAAAPCPLSTLFLMQTLMLSILSIRSLCLAVV